MGLVAELHLRPRRVTFSHMFDEREQVDETKNKGKGMG
jgi:hypothetical protein